MAIDWLGKLRRLLQVTAFCLGIASLQWAFFPERRYGPMLAYSLGIGVSTWAWIDFGRHLFRPDDASGWPRLVPFILLVGTGIPAGFVLGGLIGDMWQGARVGSSLARMGTPEMRLSMYVSALIGIGITYYFHAQGRREILSRTMQQARQHAAEARLKLLEAQLEPHMLFNTLANLRALIAVDPPRAQAMLDRLIAFLRATLGGSRVPLHPLAAEFERIADYLALMAMRLGPRLQTQLVLPDELRTASVPPLLLQPLVENSIRHGIEPQVAGGRVSVAARRDRDLLVLEVADSGAGVSGAPVPGTRFGLQQVRERLATLYGERAALALVPAPGGGTLATITLPLDFPPPPPAPWPPR